MMNPTSLADFGFSTCAICGKDEDETELFTLRCDHFVCVFCLYENVKLISRDEHLAQINCPVGPICRIPMKLEDFEEILPPRIRTYTCISECFRSSTLPKNQLLN